MFLKIQNLHWVEVACQLFTIPGVRHASRVRTGWTNNLIMLGRILNMPKYDVLTHTHNPPELKQEQSHGRMGPMCSIAGNPMSQKKKSPTRMDTEQCGHIMSVTPPI